MSKSLKNTVCLNEYGIALSNEADYIKEVVKGEIDVLFLFSQELSADGDEKLSSQLWLNEVHEKDGKNFKYLWNIKETHCNLFEDYQKFNQEDSVKNFERIYSQYYANIDTIKNCQQKLLFFEMGYEIIAKSHKQF